MKKNILFIFHSTYNFSAFALHIRELIIGTRDVVLWDFYFISLYYYSCIFSSLLYVVLRCPFYYITFCLPFSKQFFFFFFGSSSSIYFRRLRGYFLSCYFVCRVLHNNNMTEPASERMGEQASDRPTDHQIDHTEWPSSIPFFLRWRSLHRIRFLRETLLLDTIFVPFHFLHQFVRADCGWTATQTPKLGDFSEDFTGFGLSFLILIKIII